MFQDATSLEHIFKIANLTAMLAWIILIFLPRRWRLLNQIPKLIIPLLLSVAYATIILVTFSTASEGEGGFGSLAAVKILFTSDTAVLAGWLHYLAFDLFIGGYIASKADEIGLSRFIQAPILFFTFMFGPLGFFLFWCTYGGWKNIKANKLVKE